MNLVSACGSLNVNIDSVLIRLISDGKQHRGFVSILLLY